MLEEITYPSGALFSVRVYFPGLIAEIRCDVPSVTHLSISFPFSSVTINSAPIISEPFVTDFLEISTLTGVSFALTSSVVKSYSHFFFILCYRNTHIL